jgi:signal transduction histidine kinase
VAITVEITDEASTVAPPERRSELAQILREAIANAMRHARASQVRIAGHVEHGRLVLSVSDNGIGFDMAAGSTEEHHGLRNMANRARMLDAKLHIDSTVGKGTTITLAVPITS